MNEIDKLKKEIQELKQSLWYVIENAVNYCGKGKCEDCQICNMKKEIENKNEETQKVRRESES